MMKIKMPTLRKKLKLTDQLKKSFVIVKCEENFNLNIKSTTFFCFVLKKNNNKNEAIFLFKPVLVTTCIQGVHV